MQKTNHELQAESRSLKRQLGEVVNNEHDDDGDEDGDSNPKRQKTQSESDDETDSFQHELELLVRKFTSTEMLWLRELNKTFETVLDEKYQEHKRFDSLKWHLQGQIQTLLTFLPEKYHGVIDTQNMRDTFRIQMQMQRRNTVTRIRNQCGPAIFDCSVEDLADSHQRRKKFRKAIGWNEGGKTYERWNCSILHKDESTELNPSTVFLSKPMFRCFAAIFFGANAVTAFRANMHVGRGKDTVAGIWNMTHTTPGAIAMCAVFTRWAVSEDSLLQEYSKHSMIDWQHDFESYLMYLLNGIRSRRETVIKLFQRYDQVFFIGLSEEGHGAVIRKNLDDQDEQAMDILNQDEELCLQDDGSDEEEVSGSRSGQDPANDKGHDEDDDGRSNGSGGSGSGGE
ncbi:hypothetical protein K435DRAFT_688882 [Dendrothele bispora CBS 962.96]|uniref:Uncharacterized protein n=1 Tax=Dendrothele bispora (strain CBS 962.96) TaxID=1314807 RepID=A0A4S8L5S0_DENBC|nr:hypothetical protein K435DRAFT_688882 [Dendrothele bispora CBS 962.96]